MVVALHLNLGTGMVQQLKRLWDTSCVRDQRQEYFDFPVSGKPHRKTPERLVYLNAFRMRCGVSGNQISSAQRAAWNRKTTRTLRVGATTFQVHLSGMNRKAPPLNPVQRCQPA
jgi:hypothetical protein